MAETETIQILKVDTGEAVKNIGDLKQNIAILKQTLEGYNVETESGTEHIAGLTIGTQEYQETVKELAENQRALKIAMHASNEEMEDVAAAAKGATTSYNGLVAKMAELKDEFRNTTDVAKRANLGEQIKEVNDQLKEMDAMQGNFQRNVGNYSSALDGLGGILKQFPGTLGPVKEQIGKVGEAMQLVGKQPILGIIGLLAPIIQKITEQLKGNKTAMDAVKKLMESLQPILDAAGTAVEWLAQMIAKAVDWFVSLAGEGTGTFEKIVAGAVGVGNVIVQYLLTPIKTAVEAFKGLGSIIKDVFSGEFAKVKEDAIEAWDGIKDAFTNGFSFVSNFEKGQEMGRKFADGLKSTKTDAAAAAADVTGAAVDEATTKLADWEKALAEGDKRIEEERRRHAAEEKAINDVIAQQDAELNAEIAANIAELNAQQAAQAMAEQARGQARIASLFAVASATSSILSSISDMYEEDEDASEENAQKAKALKIASATIDTISGAISAYMGACTAFAAVPGLGPVMGAIQAATVLAAGIAQIKKIQATQVGSSSSSSGTSTSSLSTAMVSAPAASASVQQVSVLTGASQEEQLNQMASSQKVYILSSDIEASQNARKAQVAESSF